MKKVISILLTAVIVFSVCIPAFANDEKCDCDMTPVVYVVGFGDALYKDIDTGDLKSLFPPETDVILKSVPDLLAAVCCLLVGYNDGFGTFVSKGANIMLEELACNPDGTAAKGTGVEPMDPIVDTHKLPAFTPEDGMDEGYFKFHYDWRISPVDNAKLLDEYISEVKDVTGHDEIVLAAHSQGNTIVMTYIQLYGTDRIEKLICLSPAYQGLSLVGSLFTRNVSVADKGDALVNFLKGIMGYSDSQSKLVVSLVSLINGSGIINAILNALQNTLDSELDKVFDECLIDVFGTMPGLWTFVPAENYEDAKASMFGDNEKYSAIIEKTDYYYENVQTKTVELLNKAMANGTDVVIAAGYNISTIPVTSSAAAHGDLLIDTEYMTLGATCAEITATLGDNYAQAETGCGHNHISHENFIDASTCAFPENTWFFKGNGHNDFEEDYCEFIEWAIRYDGQPTVRSDEKYPQFMEEGESGLIPVIPETAADDRSDGEIFFSSLIGLIKESF